MNYILVIPKIHSVTSLRLTIPHLNHSGVMFAIKIIKKPLSSNCSSIESFLSSHHGIRGEWLNLIQSTDSSLKAKSTN